MRARRRTIPRPTEAELEILNVLWERGASTVRDIHQALRQRRPALYTTALKLLQIMIEKGLVERNEEQRAHVYRARFAREKMQRLLTDDLVRRAFGGSALKLAMQALSTKVSSPEDLAQIRKMLQDFERGKP